MEAFLEQIANAVTKENLSYLYTRCYIFPTKRAAIYFTEFLKEKHKAENFILPETITIQDFITNFSSFIIKDDWYLLLELHQIQNELTQTHQPLDKFLPWGKLILKDFDECDKYLVDASKLFSVLKAHKDVDDAFSISEETKKYIEQFIQTTNTKNKESIYKDNFIKTWGLLGEMYIALKQKLEKNNFAFEGMAYREVYDGLKNKTLNLPYSKVIFCGFNALSVCEEKIFKTIEQQYDTEFYWDADEHFMNNKLHEAGNFLRQYQKIFNGENNFWLIDNELKANKIIDIVGVSSNVGQVQYVANQILEYKKENNTKEKTAIILCDEQLLNPLLYAVDVSKTNITMGYSIAQSELFLFTNALFNFYGNARISTQKIEYFHKDVSMLAQHIYFKKLVLENEKLENTLPFFVPYFPQEILQEYFPKTIFIGNTNSTDILKTVINIIQTTQSKDNYFYPIKEVILEQLQYLQQSLKEKNIEIDRNALPIIVKQFLAALKIPFVKNKENEENKDENQIQIMGFLETRILDFDNLYILSLNDDNLPGTNKTNSFIPYNLRKGFGLPTFEQFDGINAYHFYRLLKRAKNINLIFNNQTGDDVSEKSRFIRQIQHDLATNDNTINECIAVMDYKNNNIQNQEKSITIKKTDIMISDLRKRAFSPSALKVYIKCPLQFYFKYIEKIDEPEELDENIDAAIFGSILHKILELTYQPYLNTTLTQEKLKTFSTTQFLIEKTKQACEQLELPKEITQGSNKLQLKIIERIAQKIIENDSLQNDLFILNTEKKFIWDKLKLEDGSFATIQGTIDRIDKINENAIRIIDYKTGAIELPKFPDKEEDFQTFLDQLFVFEKKDFSAAFQGILYALMYYKLHNCPNIYVGFHHAKNMKEGIAYLNDQIPISISLLLAFEERLSNLVSEIIYMNPNFTQSSNENAYEYSIYAEMIGMD